jgi:integrase/recombinase XerD
MRQFIIYSKEYQNYYVQFITYLQAVGYSSKSCKTFDTSVRDFLNWLESQRIYNLESVQETDLTHYYTYQQERLGITTKEGLSEKRIHLNMHVVKLFFCYLQDIEQLAINPMNGLYYPNPAKKSRENLLSQDDITKLYQACATHKQSALLGLLYGCGLRSSEAVKLNVSDIHFRSSLLYVREGKGTRKRVIPLSKTVVNDLKNYYYHERPQAVNHTDPTESFMLNKHGRRMQCDTYWEEIKKLIAMAKLNERISPHHLRHAIATHLLESGMKSEHVKDFLGHKSIETTQLYTHITISQLKTITRYETHRLPT